MTSKSSSSESYTVSFRHLLRENLKRRIWSVALSSLLFFFLLPVNMLLQVSHYLDQSNFTGLDAQSLALARQRAVRQIFANYKGWMETNDPAMAFLMICLAVVIAASAFSWLHNSRKTDFYHSLPVSRARLFHAVNLNSVLIPGVPYLIMSLLSAVIIGVATGYTGCFGIALAGFLGHMSFYLLAYMTSVLAMMLTGSVFVGLLGTWIFLTWGSVLVLLGFGLMDSYFRTCHLREETVLTVLQRSSPFAWIMDQGGDITPAIIRAAIAFGVALVLMFLSLILYKRRRSEAAGKAMAFPVSECPVRLLVTVPVAVGFGLLFHQMMDSDLWAVFGIVSALLICGCVMEIIFRFDFRQLFHDWPHLVLGLILALFIFAFFRFDIAGYDRYIPDREKVSSVGIVTNCLDNSGTYNRELEIIEDEDGEISVSMDYGDTDLRAADHMHYTDLDNAFSIVSTAVSYMQENKNGISVQDLAVNAPVTVTREGIVPTAMAVSPRQVYGPVLVVWHMKDGHDVIRRYTMDLSLIHTELDRLHDDPAYKEGFYPVFTMEPDDLAGINYADISGPAHIKFTDEAEKQLLLETYLKEFGALTAETRRQEMPVASLQFKTMEMQRAVDSLRRQNNGIGFFSDWRFYPVYPSFTETLALMERCGVQLNAALDPARIDSIMISDNRSFGDISWEDTEALRKSPLVVQDPERIREILDSSCMTGVLNCENCLGPVYYGVEAYVRPVMKEADGKYADETEDREPAFAPDPEYALESSGSWYEHDGSIDLYNYSLYFMADRIPDFIQEYFETDEADLELNAAHSY